MANKFCVRARIRELDGKSNEEALEFFREKLGEPDGHFKFDGWFSYKSTGRKFIPVNRNDVWGVEHVVNLDHDDYGMASISLSKLNAIVREMIKQFGVDRKDVKVFGYSYDEGNDEPVEF